VTQLNLVILTITTIEDSSSHTFRSLVPVVEESNRYLDVLETAVTASDVSEGTQTSEDEMIFHTWDHVLGLADERGTNIDFTDSSFM